MGYYLVRFCEKTKPGPRWGVVKGTAVYALSQAFMSLADFLRQGTPEAAALKPAQHPSELTFNLADIEVLSPVTKPTRLLCQGLNYAKHRVEAGASKHTHGPLFFRKDESAITDPFGDIVRPPGERLLDYEIELGLVIGRDISAPTQVSDRTLLDYVAGLVIANDVSPREAMLRAEAGQWYRGKSYRSMCPLGPYIYILDSADGAALDDLTLELRVNGELRQQANTRELIFKPAEALTAASEFTDLNCGDVLLTGTPGGVAIQVPNELVQRVAGLLFSQQKRIDLLVSRSRDAKFLRDGDELRSTIKSSDGRINLGEQRNRVVGALN